MRSSHLYCRKQHPSRSRISSDISNCLPLVAFRVDHIRFSKINVFVYIRVIAINLRFRKGLGDLSQPLVYVTAEAREETKPRRRNPPAGLHVQAHYSRPLLCFLRDLHSPCASLTPTVHQSSADLIYTPRNELEGPNKDRHSGTDEHLHALVGRQHSANIKS